MVFLLASFHEFTLFLKIVLWIAVPLIIISFTITTILHYRQKKKNAKFAAEHPELPQLEDVDQSIVSVLQREVLHYKKRINQLQHALSFAKDEVPKIPAADKLPAPDLTDITIAGVAAIPEVFPSTDNESGLSAMTGMPVSAEAAYLQDLVQEQRNHVHYLQQQLETRIKSYHDLEYQFRDAGEQLTKMTAGYELLRQEQAQQLETARLLGQDNDALADKVGRLENSLRELQEQHNRSLKMLDLKSIETAPETYSPGVNS